MLVFPLKGLSERFEVDEDDHAPNRKEKKNGEFQR